MLSPYRKKKETDTQYFHNNILMSKDEIDGIVKSNEKKSHLQKII